MALREAGGRGSARARGEERRAMEDFDTLAGLRGGDGGGGGAGEAERQAYAVEHLATFTVTRETGIVYPADGMRRLLQLEKTNGIWSQKMQLCVDGQWVLVMDYETASIMERFPASWVHSPTAFTSPEPAELYNNVLAFVVGAPGGGSGGHSPPGGPGDEAPPRRELHIFQCHDVGAQALVEELNALKGGGSGGGDAARDFIIERERERERDSDVERPIRQQMSAQLRGGGGGSGERGGERDDASSTGSERLYEQDIAILNRCFDDIEKFIARLQHAAAASRELERRRRGRGGGGGGSGGARRAGDGMLALRTRPPPERDFVDVLQKFKLSFNLLARLRAHIHDPNAPELVHFLFTPLALIVDAAGDATAGGRGGLPARVVQPLLTRDALNLLANCVTSKETELWHSLGDAWLVPREQWKAPLPPYQPVFMDGWSPDYPVDDQPLRRASPRRGEARRGEEVPERAGSGGGGGGSGAAGGGSAREGGYERDEPDVYADREQYVPYTSRAGRALARGDSGSAASSPEREPVYRPDDDEVGEAWARGVAARGGRVVRVTYPRTANNDKELTVVRGEYLEVLDDSRKWWKARNRRGQVAHVPHTIVAPEPHAASPPAPHPPAHHYNHYQDGGGRGSGGSSPTEPPPPPPPPPMPPAPVPVVIKNTDTMKSGKSTSPSQAEDMQEELKAVLTLYQQRRNKLDFKKTPDIFIHQKSTPDEVSEWVEAKGFGSAAARRLRMPGHELFALSRAQLERLLADADEAKRLYSQLLVQRNVSGYKTTSASELQSILRKVREKVEVN